MGTVSGDSDFPLFFSLCVSPKSSMLLKNANFSSPMLGPESFLSGLEQSLSIGLKLNLQLKIEHEG